MLSDVASLPGLKKLLNPVFDRIELYFKNRQQANELRRQAEAEKRTEADRIAAVRAKANAKYIAWKRANPERAAEIAARKAVASSEFMYYWILWDSKNPLASKEEFSAFTDQLQLFFEWRAWQNPSREVIDEALGKLLGGAKTKPNRRPIPQDVKDAVWRRDEGRCVQCGSNENLEFDHIIPISKGGANTYRNIQLLCEPCNRSKSDRI